MAALTWYPNRVSQNGVYKEGTPDYVQVDDTSSLPGYRTFRGASTDESWQDNDFLHVLVKLNDSNYKIFKAKWFADVGTTSDLLFDSLELSVGTIANDSVVEVTACNTSEAINGIPHGFVSPGRTAGLNSVTLQPGRTNSANIASGETAVAVGYESIATAYRAVGLGVGAQAHGYECVALGSYSYAEGFYSISIGRSALANDTFSIAIGSQSQVDGSYSVGIGNNVHSGSHGVAVGPYSLSSGWSGVSIGNSSVCSGSGGVSIGYHSVCSESDGVALGSGSRCEEDDGVVLGVGSRVVTGARRGIALGYNSDTRVSDSCVMRASSIMARPSEHDMRYLFAPVCHEVIKSSYPFSFVPPSTWAPSTTYSRYEFVVPTTPDGNHYFMIPEELITGLSDNTIISGLTEPDFYGGWGYGDTAYDYGAAYGVYGTNGETGSSYTRDAEAGGYWIGYDPTEFVMLIPEGSYFMVTAVGVLIDIADTITAQPQVSFGVDGSNVSLVAATATVGLTGAKTHWWTTTLSNPVAASVELRAAVVAMGTGTKLVGRFLFKGYLVEDYVAPELPPSGYGYGP